MPSHVANYTIAHDKSIYEKKRKRNTYITDAKGIYEHSKTTLN